MKKYLLLVLSMLILSSTAALAESVSFGFGTNFLKPSNAGFAVSNGHIFEVNWKMDSDVSFGIVEEETTLDYTDTNGVLDIGTLNITGIKLSKSVINNVELGIMLGSGTAVFPLATARDTSAVVDIFGTVTMVSGTGGKVAGSIKACIAARYMNTMGLTAGAFGAADAINDLNAVNASLIVTIGF